MLIDDEEDITTAYKFILQNNGFKDVDVFNNPFEALEQFRKSPEEYYDILLIDMVMPGMNGGELYDKIKSFCKKMPIICFITGHDQYYNMLKQSFPEIEGKCFIRKPIDNNELITILKQELQKTI
jgi:FixJ family two-component response regulator